MQKITFDSYKSINHRLHNKLSLQDDYSSYLKRIENIVQRKASLDGSPQFYMTFLKKTHQISSHHHQTQQQNLIQLQNKHLLQKIQKQKNRIMKQTHTMHQVHMYQKRMRQQQRINIENCKMGQRIIKQNSYLAQHKLVPNTNNSKHDKSKTNQSDKSKTNQSKISKHDQSLTKLRQDELKFFDSRLKKRKLPKLNRLNNSLNIQTVR